MKAITWILIAFGPTLLIAAAVLIWTVTSTTNFQTACLAQDGHIYNDGSGYELCLTPDGRVIEVAR